MATPDATEPSVESEGARTEDFRTEDPESGDLKSEEKEGQDLHTIALPPMPPAPIPVTSAHWQTTLESLLRFPGMIPHVRLFRPGNPVLEIASALGITDPAYTIIEHSWVPIAERVFEIQTCCLMHGAHVDFDIAADGWVTCDVTTEWCAGVLRDLQRKGFHTTCTAMVAFVVRVYSETASWVRYQRLRGRQRHKEIMDALKPDPSSRLITRCSMAAKGITSVVRQSRKRKIEEARKQTEYTSQTPPT